MEGREQVPADLAVERGPGKETYYLAIAVAVLALATAIAAMLSGFGTRWGWWHFRTGFQILRWSVYSAIALIVVSGIVVFLTRRGTGRRGLTYAAFALLVMLLLVGNGLRWTARARNVPPIHDITTDTDNPPRFVAIAPLRADAPNPVEYGGPDVAVQQRQAYPDIRPLVLEGPASAAFEKALTAARAMGWQIVSVDPDSLRIEAIDRTFWFGFVDDVVVRLTPVNGRTVLDVRSKSRFGRSDVGTNARRIREYLDAVR